MLYRGIAGHVCREGKIERESWGRGSFLKGAMGDC